MSAVLEPAVSSPPEASVAWRALLRAAGDRYRPDGPQVWRSDAGGALLRSVRARFAWKSAVGKLRFDPVFQHVVAAGLVVSHDRLLDVGCGRGLLLSLLQAAEVAAARGAWPAPWPAAPLGVRMTGIEWMAGDLALARRALGTGATLTCADMRTTPFPPSDVVVMLDVLHYVDADAQDRLLRRAREALAPGGRLLLRVGDAVGSPARAGAANRDDSAGTVGAVQGHPPRHNRAGGRTRGWVLSQWVDRLVLAVRGQAGLPMVGRPLAAWQQRLESLGFSVETQPMSRGTPFANHLLVARVGERVGERGADRSGAGAP